MEPRKITFTVEQVKDLLRIIVEEGTSDALDYIYEIADSQGVPASELDYDDNDDDDDNADDECQTNYRAYHIRLASPQLDYAINFMACAGNTMSEILDDLQALSDLDIHSMDVLIQGTKMSDEETLMPIESIWENRGVDIGWKGILDIVCVPRNKTSV